MNKENKKKQRKSKLGIVIAIITAIMLIGIILYLSKDDLIKVSKTDAAYSPTINSNGELVYTFTDSKSGYEHQSSVEEMVKDVEKTIGDYMGGTEEQNLKDTQYLIEAESISKLPYIDDIPSGELNGNIKFYRYIKDTEDESEITAEDIKEENRLKYKKFEEFNALVEEYKVSANREVFDYFTIDGEGTVIVAYGSEENRTIETGIDSSLRDRDLNEEIIKEKSGQTYAKTADNKFEMAKYEIHTKPVDYESLTAQYVMPANLLYSFLIQTGDIEFVKEIASLAYDTEIAIGIYDNINYYERTETYTYYKMLNMDIETSLEFKDTLVSITDSSPNIVLTEGDLSSTPYIDIPVWCKSITNENGVIEHEIKYLPGGGVTPTAKPDYNMYITGTDTNNKITNLGTKDSAANITKYTNIKTSMSTPSIGILLADTWISRWEITYTKEDLPGSDGTPLPSAALEDTNIQSYTDNESVLGVFEENSKANISELLNNHAGKLREDAITQIVKRTPESIFTVTPKTIGKNDVLPTQKQQILNYHYLTKLNADGTRGCSTCSGIIWGKGLGNAEISVLVEAIEKNDGVLKGTEVDNHYTADLNIYITGENSRNKLKAKDLTNKRKDEFEEQLEKEGTVSTAQKLSASKDYKDITYVSATESHTTKYKKNDVESGGRDKEKDGEKFSKIYNKRRYYVARRKMEENTSWFWDYIRENEDTAKLEELLRYLLYTATNSEIFGKFDEQRIEEIFSAFEPKEEVYMVATSSLVNLREYIRTWENAPVLAYLNGEIGYTSNVSQYITEDKTHYIMRTDGYDHPTIGFGVDIENGGFEDEFIDAGYSIEIGSLVPVEFVDALEEEEISSRLEDVRTKTSSLDLQLYQIYALVSRSYNCGLEGALETFDDLSFVDAYELYYNPEVDNTYGEIPGNEIYDHLMYTEYMSIPIKSNGTISQGLIERRKSEWVLFKTGYMDNIDRWCGIGNYPDGIRTFQAAGYTFPEYPQKNRVGDASLYANETYGNPAYGKTLGSSGCGSYTMSMILSGMLGDSSIDPITFKNNLEEYFGYSYYVNGEGSSHCIWSDKFLYKYYGVHSKENITYSEGIQALNEGKCIAAAEPGHIVAVVPVPEELKAEGYQFFVLDSARGHTGAYFSKEDFIARTGQERLTFYAIISLP